MGDDWARSDLVSMAELFSNCLTDGSFDSNVLIEIMEQLAQSDNPQQLRRLQTVMAASTHEFVAIYNDTKLETRFLTVFYMSCFNLSSDNTINC